MQYDAWQPEGRVDAVGLTFVSPDKLETNYYLLNAVSDAIVSVDREHRISYANQAACRLLGRPRSELRGRDFRGLILVDREAEQRKNPGVAALSDAEILDRIYGPALEDGEIVASDDVQLIHKTGECLHAVLTAIPVESRESGEVEGALLVCRDLTPGVLLDLNLRQREELLTGIFELIPTGILLLNSNGNLVRMNATARRVLQLSEQDARELRGRPLPPAQWRARKENESTAFQDAPFQRSLATNAPHEEVYYLESVGGYMLVSSSPLGRGAAPMIITTFTGVEGPRRAADRRLDATVQLSSRVNGLLTRLLTEQGADRTIETALSGTAELLTADLAVIALHESEDDTLRFAHLFSKDPKVMADFQEFRTPALDTPYGLIYHNTNSFIIEDYAGHRLSQPEFTQLGAFTFIGAPIMSENRILGAVYFFRTAGDAFSEQEREHIDLFAPVLSASLYKAGYEAKLNELAATDPLTGLWNRRVFFQELEKEIERAERYSSTFSMLMVDLDFFKEVNDEHGHLAGDEVLMRVAECLQQHTRKADLVARSGGEEFLILLPETELDGAVTTAEKIRSRLAALSIAFNGRSLHVTVSIGCGQHARGERTDGFYSRIDGLLYKSKRAGRNRVSH